MSQPEPTIEVLACGVQGSTDRVSDGCLEDWRIV